MLQPQSWSHASSYVAAGTVIVTGTLMVFAYGYRHMQDYACTIMVKGTLTLMVTLTVILLVTLQL